LAAVFEVGVTRLRDMGTERRMPPSRVTVFGEDFGRACFGDFMELRENKRVL
jgi:hypothetical protein